MENIVIPTLTVASAKEFLRRAEKNLKSKNKTDFHSQHQNSIKILKKAKLC